MRKELRSRHRQTGPSWPVAVVTITSEVGTLNERARVSKKFSICVDSEASKCEFFGCLSRIVSKAYSVLRTSFHYGKNEQGHHAMIAQWHAMMIKLADAANLRFSFIFSYIFFIPSPSPDKAQTSTEQWSVSGTVLGPTLFLFWSATSNSIMIKQFVTERQAYLADSETLRRAARGRESSWRTRRRWAWSCMLTVASQEDADYHLIAVSTVSPPPE
jgi:hypothetical protein